ncbi:MAG TPA: LuxR C-terminal-related transcriptional regulator [Ktedonobacteraceae bacterium]
MGRAPLHALIWSQEQRLYELHTQDRLEQRFQPTDEATWQSWLREVTSFAFHSPAGSLNVYLERRPRGGAYWYAYQTTEGRTRKRYLGRTQTLSLAHLEQTARSLRREQQPPQAFDQGMLVLSGRLAPPRLPAALVERETLLSALDGALATPLTLLCAPAGFGKTTLLATWARRNAAQVAWLSLDELDASPTRFWVALIAALRRCGGCAPSFGETAVALLESPQPPPLPTILTVLLQELEGRSAPPAPIVLIVDDYQVIEDPAIHQGMSFFLEHLPAHVHLLLASRVDPDLPVARWRVRGQLTEIRADELRFQEGEASQYLGQMLSPPLSQEEVQGLVSRTEGWIAGLHLAVLTLQKRTDRAAFLQALSGSQRYLLDYVQEEILARLPERVRDFLLHTAILSRLDAAVCQAVTGAPERRVSQQMLAFLERANLFLVSLDEERRSYRLHELFREALLSALSTTHPESVAVLHRRAAHFYEAQGEWAEAITHALQAADYSTAANLMEQTVEQFWLRGEAATIARWVLALPDRLARDHARLLLTTALYLLNTVVQTTREQRERRYQEARQLMARVEAALQGEIDAPSSQSSATGAEVGDVEREASAAEHALLQWRLRVLRRLMAVLEASASGEFERLGSMQEVIEEAQEHGEEAIWQTVPLGGSFTFHYTVRREGAQLLPRLLAVKERVSQEASRFASIRVRQWLALAAVRAGQLRLASEESQEALNQIEHMQGFALLKGYVEVALAQVYYQWNRLEEARALLRMVVHHATAWQQLEQLAWGYAELIQVELARRDRPAAELALHEVEQLVQRERFGIYPGWLPAMQAQWWLAQGQLEVASKWAASVVFPEGPWEGRLYDAFPVVMRVYFAERSFREAMELLDSFRGHLDRPANMGGTITYLSQSLVALHHAGKPERARLIAARLFALTEPEGYLRVYLDEGEPMRQALLALLAPHSRKPELAPSSAAYLSKLLAVFEYEKHDASPPVMAAPTGEPALSPARQTSAISSVPAVSLTRREQEVLRLLAAGASNQDIAHTLVISLDAVKKHVSNLLGKLGASSRTQAIIQARARSLL